MKIVINSGNGAAGPVIDDLIEIFKKNDVPFEFVKVNHEPDSSFPNGIPNPIIKENQSATSEVVIENQADFGVAFDGDFDRCFFFDNRRFVPGEYVVGLLANVFEIEPGATIVHDPRLIWNTTNVVENQGGKAIVSNCHSA